MLLIKGYAIKAQGRVNTEINHSVIHESFAVGIFAQSLFNYCDHADLIILMLGIITICVQV